MSSLVNKIYVLNGPFDLQINEEVLDSNNLDDDQILAKTVYSCISPGTELAAYVGLPPLRPSNQYPRLVGYCNVAKVIKRGNGIKEVNEASYILTFFSHTQYFKCQVKDIIAVLPNEIDLRKVCSVYLFHLGYIALLESSAQAGMKVGIIGLGTLGYCTALLSNLFGYDTIVFSNQSYLRSEIEEMGIQFSSKSTYSNDLLNSLDVIVNTSNSWNDWFLSLELMRKKGVMVNLGFPGRGHSMSSMNPLDSRFFYDKQLTIKSTGHVYDGEAAPWDVRFSLKRNIEFLLGLIVKGKIDPGKILSIEEEWQNLENLYKYFLDKDGRKFTGILNWN